MSPVRSKVSSLRCNAVNTRRSTQHRVIKRRTKSTTNPDASYAFRRAIISATLEVLMQKAAETKVEGNPDPLGWATDPAVRNGVMTIVRANFDVNNDVNVFIEHLQRGEGSGIELILATHVLNKRGSSIGENIVYLKGQLIAQLSEELPASIANQFQEFRDKKEIEECFAEKGHELMMKEKGLAWRGNLLMSMQDCHSEPQPEIIQSEMAPESEDYMDYEFES